MFSVTQPSMMRLHSLAHVRGAPAGLDGYGVAIGTHQCQWLHELLHLNCGGQMYEVSVDVNEPNGLFEYQMIGGLDRGLFSQVLSLNDGYHDLPRNSTSGAQGYLRSPFIQQPEGCLTVLIGFLNSLLHGTTRCGARSPAPRPVMRWSPW